MNSMEASKVSREVVYKKKNKQLKKVPKIVKKVKRKIKKNANKGMYHAVMNYYATPDFVIEEVAYQLRILGFYAYVACGDKLMVMWEL